MQGTRAEGARPDRARSGADRQRQRNAGQSSRVSVRPWLGQLSQLRPLGPRDWTRIEFRDGIGFKSRVAKLGRRRRRPKTACPSDRAAHLPQLPAQSPARPAVSDWRRGWKTSRRVDCIQGQIANSQGTHCAEDPAPPPTSCALPTPTTPNSQPTRHNTRRCFHTQSSSQARPSPTLVPHRITSNSARLWPSTLYRSHTARAYLSLYQFSHTRPGPVPTQPGLHHNTSILGTDTHGTTIALSRRNCHSFASLGPGSVAERSLSP